jgi:hypothetical protein
VSAGALLLVGLILTANISFPPSLQPTAAFNHGRKAVGGDFGHYFDSPALQTGERLRETFSTSIGKEFDGKELPQNLPLEWEDEFFAIFEENASSDQVDRRLIELATGKAAGQARVQRECLRHLAYSLPDESTPLIARVAAHQSIPLLLRVEFVSLALSIRPSEVTRKFIEATAGLPEVEIVSAAHAVMSDR